MGRDERMTQVDLAVLESTLDSLVSSTHLEVWTPYWGVRASGLRSPYRSHVHYEFFPGHGGRELVVRNYRHSLVVANRPPEVIDQRHRPIGADSPYEEEWRGGMFPGDLACEWLFHIINRLQVPHVRWDLDGEFVGLWTLHPTVGTFNGRVPCPRMSGEAGRQVEDAWDEADNPMLRLRIGGVEARPLVKDLPLPILGAGAEMWGVSIGPDHGDYRASVAVFGDYGWAIVRGPTAILAPEGRLELPEGTWVLRIPIPRRRA